MEKITSMAELVVEIHDQPLISLVAKAGADGVILIPEKVNTGYPETISWNALDACAAEAANYSLKGYALINRFFPEEDLPVLRDFLIGFADRFAGIYFRDPAVVSLARERGLANKLIAADDMIMTNPQDIHVWLSQGIQAGLVSPDISGAQATMCLFQNQPMDVVVYGYLPLALSRRQFATAFGWPARHSPYVIHEESREQGMLLWQDHYGTTIYEDGPMKAGHWIHTFAKAGARNLIIRNVFDNHEEIEQAAAYVREQMRLEDSHEPCIRGFYERGSKIKK